MSSAGGRGNRFLEEHYERYLALGWSPIPVEEQSKKPLVSWQRAQENAATIDRCRDWAFRWTNSGIGIVTGAISGVMVIDVDSPEAALSPFVMALPRTATVKTGKGWHYYYSVPVGVTAPTKVKFLPGIDCRGEGGYAIVPPSIHVSGAIYEWINRPEDGIAEVPASVLATIAGTRGTLESFTGPSGDTRWKSALAGQVEGGRNDSAAALIGKLLADAPMEMWETMCWKYVNEEWNFHNNPPLPSAELRATFDSISRKERDKREGFEVPTAAIQRLSDTNDMVIEPKVEIVKGLIVEGLTSITAKPKEGKSILALQIGLAVASGKPLFKKGSISSYSAMHSYETLQGDVLYIALEDDRSRLVQRARDIMGTNKLPKAFAFTNEWRGMFDGGMHALEKYLDSTPNCRLVVIDTLVAFSSGDKTPRSSNAFTADYRLYKPLSEIAQRHSPVAIVVITHARKDGAGRESAQGSRMDKISGTLGAVAAVDHFIQLERMAEGARIGSFFLTGRDVPTYMQPMKQEPNHYAWLLATTGEMDEFRESRKAKKLNKDGAA